VDALESIAGSPNSKVVIMPADVPAAIRGLMGGLKG
jgi:hypothetical protein